ncbi:hypothetical protein [Clostridium magnum]|uniref:Uncharacterized protein n=1 Tax=Clostridium magnum DSM 2767 TaxID=1121326 RepID=A0A161WKM2_9CLOT|nr:hypothetical protein [Clostridium magnum]KZL92275.1 hypothetical protein CLMAG_20840 [Clostridium magnum DSM 2767]SHH15287.1 hypothetical protein SAMN02745944_00143 [Clostridium magnum DSM 2767]
MKKSKMFTCFLFTLIIVFVCSISVSANVWVFGSSGTGNNPFTAKGFAIKTESGQVKWLYSKFSNGGYDANGDIIMQDGGTSYTGNDWGLKYISAAKSDGKSYDLFAMTNRNPKVYNYMFAYKKQSQKGKFTPISNFTSCLGAPIQTSVDLLEFPNGIDHELAIPINNFVFEPGTLYEFGFQQGMRANNGISLVLSGDSIGHYYGYLKYPFSPDEQALYDRKKYEEYQFISSYTPVAGTDYFNVNFVPMRFSVQTFADLSAWNTTAAEVQSFIDGMTQSNYDSGRWSKTNIDNLKAELSSMQNEADNVVKYQLKAEADQSIAQMINKITNDMNSAKTTDMTKLDAKLQAAKDFYDDAKNNVGTEVGNYLKESVDTLKQTIDTASAITNQSPQSDIDSAVKELDNAIINVKASQKTDKIVLNDYVNGITVTLNRGSVPDNVSLIVNRVDAADQRYRTYKDSIGENVKEIEIFSLLLYSGDKKIQPSKPMTVQFPVPDSMKSNDISAYLSGDDLKSGKVSSVRMESFVQVNSSTTGYFSLVSSGKAIVTSTADNSKTDDSSTEAVTKTASKDNVNVTKQTDLNTKKNSYEKEKLLDITAGAGNTTMSVTLKGENRPQEKIAVTVIPVSEVLKKGNPFWLLLSAAVLGIFGAVNGGVLIIRKIKKGVSLRR